ncbi:Antibiotic biosynthesis monooxygenase [Planctomycetes bacterium CA13]|uniref:Antibiotic biosynthesis monooxygenase n=1 Tax=Novipirellula herctigrandis TaxID=2527986 RepID=A0A5C5ZBJ6_9BACT|nr:Antibiotic biosynthesis monooxygenase [Planctomycetes bacterium CA13]
MFIVTVTFEVSPPQLQAFRDAMQTQAKNSLELEAECHQFDVCYDSVDSAKCFLYEKYADRAAFDKHLASDHFKQFDLTVGPWIVSKSVQTWIQESA